MKYSLIWADNGAILDNKIVCDSIQDAYAKKKKYQKSVRLMVSPAACVTMWAVEWDAEREPVDEAIFYSGYKHFIVSGVTKAEAFKKRLMLDAAGAKNVKMYEYVRQIID